MGRFSDNLLRRRKWRDDGDCFKASADFILDLHRDPQWDAFASEHCILVHGMPTLQRPPFIQYAHAWIEVPAIRLVLNVATGREAMLARDLYYRIGQIDPKTCFRYTPEQARQMILRFEHYGPWEGPEASQPTQQGEATREDQHRDLS